ncbi:MAG TPA: hypothetical protein VG273_02440 [Bryobacteraceae bacterium]|nr:hypothetical protein [Bryobacteraceae bacterium]
MRTTLTLDDDLAERLQREARSSGQRFKSVVNEMLRLALDIRTEPPVRRSLVWRETPLRTGLDFESTSELLDRLDGPAAP